MIAAVRADIGLEVRDVTERRDGYVTLDVEACGLCGTDLKILEDPPGHPYEPGVVLGHEIVGWHENRRYVVEPNITCGHCPSCRSGAWMDCDTFSTIGIFQDGGFAPRVRVPVSTLHEVSGLPQAVLAEPASCVVHALARAGLLETGERGPRDIAILGGGIIGQIFQAFLPGSVIEDPSPHRRSASPSAVLPGQLSAGSAEIVIDAYGSGLERAVDLVKPGGQIVLFGMNEKAAPNGPVPYLITRKEITVIGAYVGQGMFPRTIQMLPRLESVYRRCVKQYPLDAISQAVEDARAGTVVKAVIRPPEAC